MCQMFSRWGVFFFLAVSGPPRSTLFPYTTLFRSLAFVALAQLLKRSDAGRGMSTREGVRSEEHTSELQSRRELVCRLLLEKKKLRLQQSDPYRCAVLRSTSDAAVK